MKWRQGVLLGMGLLWALSGASGPVRAQGPTGGQTLSPPGNEREVRSRIYVSPTAGQRAYQKVSVLPFQASVDLVGASLSDLFFTELLTTRKYPLLDRTQSEQLLLEKDPDRQVVSESAAAVKAGRLLGVQGVIIGTVPEYGVKLSGTTELLALGITVRMIDVSDGSIVWSISDIAVSDRSLTLSALALQTVRKMVAQLFEEMIRVGDLQAVTLPIPRVLAAEGKSRGVLIEIQSDSPGTVSAYKILRSRAEKGPFQETGSIDNPGALTVRFEDRDLLDGETYYYQVLAVSRTRLTSLPSPSIKATTSGPPGAVSGLAAQSGLIRRVILTWQPLTDPNIKGYRVLRRSKSGSWEKISTLEGREQSTFTDQGLGDVTTYAYQVISSYKDGQESPPSPTVTATTKGPPSRVQKLEAVSKQARKVPLSWTPVDEPEVKGYAVFRAPKGTGPFEKIALVEGRETSRFVDGAKRGFFEIASPLNDETRYYYKVQAVNIVDVHGEASPTDNAVTKPVPEPVAGLQANRLEVKQVSLKWKAGEEEDIARYEVYRGRDGQSVNTRVLEVPATSTQAVDKGLADGSEYYYRVRAVDQDGLEGNFSNLASSVTKPVPVKPQGLKAVLEGNRVRLTWRPNPEKDIAGYRISQKSFFLFWEKVGEAPGTEFLYQGELKKGKTLYFRLTAVDQTQLEGEPSEEVSLAVP
jgi:fibronectin type 3 domain-containing protein